MRSISCLLSLTALLLSPALAADRKEGDVRFLPPREVELSTGEVLTIDLGKVSVPENRRDADSRLIEIAFARLRALTEAPGPPLIYLHGGPGGSATGAFRSPEGLLAWRPFLDLGDVVLLDQRGCGESEPDLRARVGSPLPGDLFESREAAGRYVAGAANEAARALRATGIDFSAYHTEASLTTWTRFELPWVSRRSVSSATATERTSACPC
jgi:hypothetical protein